MNDDVEVKDDTMAKYRELARQKAKSFHIVDTRQIPRADNQDVDLLAKLAASLR